MRFSRFLPTLSTSFLLLGAPACDPNGPDSAPLECGADMECDGATQYCAIKKDHDGDPTPEYFCLAKPKGCDACGCIDVAADLQVDSCSATACESTNELMSIECTL